MNYALLFKPRKAKAKIPSFSFFRRKCSSLSWGLYFLILSLVWDTIHYSLLLEFFSCLNSSLFLCQRPLHQPPNWSSSICSCHSILQCVLHTATWVMYFMQMWSYLPLVKSNFNTSCSSQDVSPIPKLDHQALLCALCAQAGLLAVP